MGAPTWPPTPEQAHEATLEEYGDDAKAVLPADDDEAERALLAPFLFAPPKRQLVAGEENGTTLDELHRSLHGWLQMIAGRHFELAYGDPASTDGTHVFLPRAVPAPALAAEDALLYRAMGLMQLGLVDFGFLKSRKQVAELHTDWVLRSCYHLLAARFIVRQWSKDWPGIRNDFEAIRFLDKAGTMRVNVTEVPKKGMPGAFLPLYRGLTDFLDEAGAEGDAAHRAVEAIDAVDDPQAAPLVVSGQALKLRHVFREMRLGAPPLPYFVGIIRPEWILHDLAADIRAANEWKKGSKPLRQLLKKVKNDTGGRLSRAVRGDGPPRLDELVTSEITPPPSLDADREYDEWDDDRGIYKVATTLVEEIDAPAGPLESYQRIATANQAQIKEVRRRFEALRLEEKWVHGQPDGTEIDLNRAVAAMADIAAGVSPQRVDWYVRFQRQRQSVAILTLVDLSGSTQGNIIHLEQEALVLFAEGLRVLRFPHAFYGFSNQGPRACRFQRIKAWDDPYDDAVFKRIGNLRPGGATRLGAFLRHATWSLGQQPQARRILLVLSDGKPEDRAEYRGRYGIRDTAMAVLEARREGILTFCISLDTNDDTEGYLTEIFGKDCYLILDRVDDLPKRLPEVFRGLVD